MAHQRLALVFLSVVLLIGCDAIPRDSAGALTRVRGGELRVGMADNPPWVRFEGGRVAGFEPELIEAWAKELGARGSWKHGAEAELIEALHRREADVLAARARQQDDQTRVVSEPSMGEGNAAVEAPSFRSGRMSPLEVQQGVLRVLPITDVQAERDLCLIWRHDSRLPAVRAFLEVLHAQAPRGKARDLSGGAGAVHALGCGAE